MSNARVIWYSDYQNVESVLLNGSRKFDLQVLAFKHYRFGLNIAFHLMLSGYFIDFIDIFPCDVWDFETLIRTLC